MNPLAWDDAPVVAVWTALFAIAFLRGGATHLVGRLARRGAVRWQSVRRRLAAPGYRRAEAALNRYSAPVVSLGFLTIGFQTMVNLASGTTRMPALRYVPALAVGAALWATVYATVGFVGLRAVGLAYGRWPIATLTVAGVLLLAALAVTLLFLRRRGAPPSSDPRGEAAGPDDRTTPAVTPPFTAASYDSRGPGAGRTPTTTETTTHAHEEPR
ncbi:DedA family protein [Brevibacterium litoralis]|uniref:DedA family protein n=1 Tax=Brevibacterium litoralis TaxID=3138935 RepID=UPI0032EEF57E